VNYPLETYPRRLEVNTFQMCKACDHDIVRALETQPKALPWKDEI